MAISANYQEIGFTPHSRMSRQTIHKGGLENKKKEDDNDYEFIRLLVNSQENKNS